MQIGGDSQNTTPVAIQSGLAAQKLAKPMMDAAKEAAQNGGAKLPWDKFVSTVKDQTMKNVPLSDAMQQQSMFVRWAQKIPGVGPRITAWLGPEALINNTIGTLPKEVLKNANAAELTRIVYEGGDDVAKKLLAAGVPQETAEALAKAGAERLGTQVATSAATTVANQAAGLTDDVVKAAIKGYPSANKVGVDAIKKVLEGGGDDVLKGLTDLGLTKKAAETITGRVAQSGATQAVEAGAQQVAKKGAEEGVKAASGGVKGFFGKLLSGAKGNFIIAGVFSLGSNAIQLATGKMNLKQFAALTGMDTLAYGAIGLGASAAGGAIAGAVGQALIPIPGLGFLVGLGLGMAGGLIYEKFLRNPVKDMLGGGGAGQPLPNEGMPLGQYQDPYATQPDPNAVQIPDPWNTPNSPPQTAEKPYQPAVIPNPWDPTPTPAAPGAAPGGDMSYEQAMEMLNAQP